MADDVAQLVRVVAAIEEVLPTWGFGSDKISWLSTRRRDLVERTRPRRFGPNCAGSA
jgi:hypothetical protein